MQSKYLESLIKFVEAPPILHFQDRCKIRRTNGSNGSTQGMCDDYSCSDCIFLGRINVKALLSPERN